MEPLYFCHPDCPADHFGGVDNPADTARGLARTPLLRPQLHCQMAPTLKRLILPLSQNSADDWWLRLWTGIVCRPVTSAFVIRAIIVLLFTCGKHSKQLIQQGLVAKSRLTHWMQWKITKTFDRWSSCAYHTHTTCMDYTDHIMSTNLDNSAIENAPYWFALSCQINTL